MLIDNAIFARWFRTTAGLDDFDSILEQFVCADKQTLTNEIFAVSWREKTRLSFGPTDWSSTEDSIVVENQRAILWRRHEGDATFYDLVFVALMQSSLLHLCEGFANLVKGHSDVDVVPVEITLSELVRSSAGERLRGLAMTNAKRDRIIISGRRPWLYLPFSVSRDEPHDVQDYPSDRFFLSEIYLSLGQMNTSVTVSRDGFLTFPNPQLAISEIAESISEISEMMQPRSSE